MIAIKACTDRETWDDYVLEHDGHPLQLWGWGETKAAHGWKAERLLAYDVDNHILGGAQVLIRKLPWPFKAMAYVPRGPIVSSENTTYLLEALANHVRSQHGVVVLSIEPDWVELPSLPKGWRRSDNTILIPDTLILDLNKTAEELQAPMSKKTRQYIRKSAGEEGVEIRQVKDREELEKCMQVYHQTADRAGFALHSDDYYYDVFTNLGEASPVFAAYLLDSPEILTAPDSSRPAKTHFSSLDVSTDTPQSDKMASDSTGYDSGVSEVPGKASNGWPVAFLWLAISASTAFELYGGMNDDGQQLRANYALKWHAITKMKEWGIERYDMNGLVSDGVSNFKRGFADHEDQLIGTYDKPLSPLYIVWTHLLPFAKRAARLFKR